MQKVFDVDNKEDMDLLWSILPDDVYKIEKYPDGFISPFAGICAPQIGNFKYIKINWHDKTEITRPVNYEDMIGCVGWFWSFEESDKDLGRLTKIDGNSQFLNGDGHCYYKHFTPAKKSELKFYGEQDE